MTRTEQILALRPNIKTDETKVSLTDEYFQNNTLRPILKFQNELILALVKNQLSNSKIPENEQQKQLFIQQHIQKNQVLKQQLIGLTIGLFTQTEMDFYLENQTEINKRISQLMVKRVTDQV
jgi:hypothetical protein